MNVIRILQMRLRAILGRRALADDMQAEMRQHIERATERLMTRGMSRDEARLAARREFGNVSVLQDSARDARGMRWVDDLRGDLLFAFRYFARNKATTAIVVAVLALGIGANTVIFAALQAEFTRPAPAVPNDDRLVRVWSTQRDTPTARWNERDLTSAELQALSERKDIFESVAAWHAHDVVLVGPDSTGPHGVRAQFVTPNYFATIGIAIAGPGFALDAEGADMSVVLSNGMAEQLYETPTAAVGQRVLVNDLPVRIVGVAPPRFQGARRNAQRPALWIAVSARAGIARVSPRWMEENAVLELVGRLTPNASHEQATGAARGVAYRSLPDSAARVGLARNAQVLDLEAIAPGNLEVLLTVTGFSFIGLLILLVTCTNVSSLMVASATGRRHEIAVRLSLGASRARIIRQLLTETTLLTIAGGAAGILLTWWAAAWLDSTRNVQGVDLRPDLGTLGFMLLLACGTGIVFGLTPALHATRGKFSAALSDSGAGATSRSRLQRVFVTTQIVLSQPLLVMLGVMLSFAIQDFRPMPRALSERLVRVTFRPLSQTGGPAQRREAVEALIPRIAEHPEVHSVIPEAAGYALRYVNVPTPSRGDSLLMLRVMGTPAGWLEQMDTQILLGRDVTFADTSAAEPPVVIGSQLARRLWGESSPIGRVLVSTQSADGDRDTVRALIVGVYQQPASVSEDDVIRIHTAHDARWRRDALMIRTRGPAEPFLPELRLIIRAAAPGLPVSAMETQAQHDEGERSIALQISVLAGAAAALALLLASLGLYGVVSLAVRQRTREIGIRIAVGATPTRVARMFLASGVRLGAIALLLGLPVCVIGLHFALANRVLIAPDLNPWHIGVGVTVVLLTVVSLASWIPARRATAVDPARTLRVE
ncbi:MAG: ABC transporter permease [Gemmatimonadaceae bacterium]